MSRLYGLILDLDGVIADTEKLNARVTAYTFCLKLLKADASYSVTLPLYVRVNYKILSTFTSPGTNQKYLTYGVKLAHIEDFNE